MRHLCQKELASPFKYNFLNSNFLNLAQFPLRITEMRHAARLNQWYRLSHNIDIVNADQFRNGVGLVGVDRVTPWRLPG